MRVKKLLLIVNKVRKHKLISLLKAHLIGCAFFMPAMGIARSGAGKDNPSLERMKADGRGHSG